MTDLVKYEVAEVDKWGEFAKKSGVLPSNCNQFQAAAIVQTGRELGLAPMQSIRSMCFVNGRLTMSVQLQLALAKNKGVKITNLTEKEDSCTVTLERDGEKVTCEFNAADAKKAGLDTKDNWKKYGKQIYRWRAIGDALRLIAPDLVMGLLDPIEASSIDPPAPAVSAPEVAVEVVEPVVANPVAPPPVVTVEKPSPAPPSTEKKDDATLRHELQELAAIAVDAGHFQTEAQAIYFATAYTTKDGKEAGYKDVVKLKGWQMSKAIAKLSAKLDEKPSTLDEERNDDIKF